MAVTAAMVKELREMTGAGVMACKNALVETDGNFDSAIELLRKKGEATAVKKAGRIAAEGTVLAIVEEDKNAAIVEVNSETDFVAKNEKGSATGISLEATTGNNLTLNGTTINAQGNKSYSNGSTAIFAQKGNLLQGFDGDATDNITLADSNIINGGIETIVTAGNKTGIHTVNLNIKDGSVIGAANNKQTIYASASAQGAGSATQNLNLSVPDSTIY